MGVFLLLSFRMSLGFEGLLGGWGGVYLLFETAGVYGGRKYDYWLGFKI